MNRKFKWSWSNEISVMQKGRLWSSNSRYLGRDSSLATGTARVSMNKRWLSSILIPLSRKKKMWTKTRLTAIGSHRVHVLTSATTPLIIANQIEATRSCTGQRRATITCLTSLRRMPFNYHLTRKGVKSSRIRKWGSPHWAVKKIFRRPKHRPNWKIYHQESQSLAMIPAISPSKLRRSSFA